MKDSSCLNQPLQYYCTAGTGMEQFLAAEVQCKLAAHDVDHVTGKVFFTTPVDIEKVAGLKSAERLFLLLRRAPPLSQTENAGRVEDVIQDQIVGQRSLWTGGFSQWRRLRKVLEGMEPEPKGPGRGRKRKLEQGERPACEGLERAEERAPGMEGQGPDEKRRDHGDERRESGVEGRNSVVERRDSGEKRHGRGLKGQDSGVDGRGSGVEGRDSGVDGPGSGVEGRDSGVDGRDSGVEGRGLGLEGRGLGLEAAMTGPSRGEAPPSSERSSEEGGVSEPQPAPVSFRVCCRSSGSAARMLSCQDLGRVIGVALSKQLGWTVNLREPDLEVSVHLSQDHCVVGLPLLRSPLASRSYIKTTGLRSTVAWAMASLAEIKPGSCVLDPMCGVGTILLEAAQECPNSFFLGMDLDELQLAKASDNVQFAKLTERVEVIKSSVMAIPVPSDSMDAVICDIPFGRKFGKKSDMAACLPAIVKEMERVLCVGGALVLLLSPALAAVLKRSCRPQPATPVSRERPGLRDPARPPSSSQR
ncbi:hypothetical protein COCON_G00224310 [Conger conger]|uniref:THUMP domain-containing protein 2 n=1 Tax=Conger conger TaxID=82655 RepID=A0A9Q1CWM8_CONCO|nr:hypothetical protein COCON_G00224310 [Conger conger]